MRRADPATFAETSKSYEPDRYVAALLAPATKRHDIQVLAAFAAELQRIAIAGTEPLIGEIRLQWWSDALRKGASPELSGNPLADDLSFAARTRGWPQDAFDAVIDAARLRLYEGFPQEKDALVAEAAALDGGLFKLAAMILADDGAADRARSLLLEAVTAAGISYGLARLAYLETMPRKHRDGTSADPGLDHSGRAFFHDLSTEAEMQLKAARAAVRLLPHSLRGAFLPLALVEPYLRAVAKNVNLQAPNIDSATQSVILSGDRNLARITQLGRMWRLWRAHLLDRM